jgi:adenylate cyclase
MRVDVHKGDAGPKSPIDASILFADLRGYTTLSQSQSPEAVSGLLDAFYDECANAIWECDGLLNKTIGDAIMAVFNFPIGHEDHLERGATYEAQLTVSWSGGTVSCARSFAG